MEDLQVIQHILYKYEQASGQQINRTKTTLFFNKAVVKEKKRKILNFLGVPEIKEYEKHIDFLAVVGREKKASLNYIKERVWTKITRLEGKALVTSR